MNTTDFLEKFPKTKLNIENENINLILASFIIKHESKLNKSWQVVGKLLKDFFKENNIEFAGKSDKQTVFWESRGWNNPMDKVKETRSKWSTPNQKRYWIKKGYSETESEKKVKEYVKQNLSNTSVEYWEKKGYSESEAKEKCKVFYSKMTKDRLLPTQLAYYTSKGMSEEDAKEALTKEQAKRTQKLIDKETQNPELRRRRLWTHIDYWLNKGYTHEQGIQLMKERFESRNLQTMKKLVNSYIERGLSESEAIEKAHKDYKKRASKTMQTRIKNNSFGFQKASQMSLNFFKPLMEKLDQQGIEYYVGAEGNAEFFLASGTEYFYSYDFCIPSQKLIIEFHGEHVHPNPKMTKEQWDAWVHCWSRKSADECREEDLKKIHLAESKGFKVIEVFESDALKSLDLI